MRNRGTSWFSRHRGLIIGFAMVVLVLNLGLFAVRTEQKTFSGEYESTQYSLGDPSFARGCTVGMEGTWTRSLVLEDEYYGTLSVGGIDELREPVMIRLMQTGEKGTRSWKLFFLDEETGTAPEVLTAMAFSRDGEDICICFGDPQEGGTFLCVGINDRNQALRIFEERFH